MINKKTKVVCTIGPASENRETMTKMIKSGMNVARLNFSHGDYAEHQGRIDLVRVLAKELNEPLAIALDTKGPEIRAGIFKDGKVTLTEGSKFFLTTDDIEGDENGCSVSHKELYKWVKAGNQILVNDGLIGLRVTEVKANVIWTIIENGGELSNKKSVNVPGVSIPMGFLSEKDKTDLAFAAKNNLDFVFASFTRNGEDIIQLKKHLKDVGGESIQVIAKIENHEGINNFDDILKHSDGIMVARGDLGVEIPLEQVPVQQKMMIRKTKLAGKIIITATQMLESMTKNPRPTRAEASDVANAVFQGTSAVMLSGESAAGKYPAETVETMAKIAIAAELSTDYWANFKAEASSVTMDTIGAAIGHAACDVAASLNAKAILVLTRSGYTAREIARHRPGCPIVAKVVDEHTKSQLSLVWGVYPFLGLDADDVKTNIEQAIGHAQKLGYVQNGDLIIIAAGLPVGTIGTTNFLKAHRVGDTVL